MENCKEPKFELVVKQGEKILIPPAERTYKGLYFLSSIDQQYFQTNVEESIANVATIYGFTPGEKGKGKAVEMGLKNALSKVLVHFYPLAGRLRKSPEGRLVVDCTGEGALFVEAEANCRVEDIGDVTKPDPMTLGKLVYDISTAQNILEVNEVPLLMAQLTKFKCGGFVLGLCLNHGIADGIAAMNFVNAWGEISRALPISNPPFLDRTILKSPNPLEIRFPHHEKEFAEIEDISNMISLFKQEILYESFCFDSNKLEKLKLKAMEDGVVASCTTFEALAAFVWRARSGALSTRPDQKMKLTFAVDTRSRFHSKIPRGYFGNAFVLACSICAAGELVEKPLSFAVGLVQEAIKLITYDYVRSMIDYIEVVKRAPSRTAATVSLAVWFRLPFHTTDFGWGEPILSGPVRLPPKELVMFLPHGTEKKGINVLLGLPAPAMESFQELMQF